MHRLLLFAMMLGTLCAFPTRPHPNPYPQAKKAFKRFHAAFVLGLAEGKSLEFCNFQGMGLLVGPGLPAFETADTHIKNS